MLPLLAAMRVTVSSAHRRTRISLIPSFSCIGRIPAGYGRMQSSLLMQLPSASLVPSGVTSCNSRSGIDERGGAGAEKCCAYVPLRHGSQACCLPFRRLGNAPRPARDSILRAGVANLHIFDSRREGKRNGGGGTCLQEASKRLVAQRWGKNHDAVECTLGVGVRHKILHSEYDARWIGV